jgi:hypothetical protein
MSVSEEEAYHHHIHQIEQREDKDEEDAGEDDPADSRILQRTEHQDRLIFETADQQQGDEEETLLASTIRGRRCVGGDAQRGTKKNTSLHERISVCRDETERYMFLVQYLFDVRT